MSFDLFDGTAAQCLKNNRDEGLTLRAFDLLEGLDIVVLGAVHNTQDLSHKLAFISRPMTP